MVDEKKTEKKSETAPSPLVPNPEKAEDKKADDKAHLGTTTRDVEAHVESGKATQEAYDQVHKRISDILESYGNRESEIPLNNEYWALRNQMVALRSDLNTQRAMRIGQKKEDNR